MNKFLGLALALIVACGGNATEATNATEYPGIANGNTLEENDAEFAQLGEAINIGNGGYGFANAASQLRCAQPGTSGQNCFASAVASKTVGYCFQGFSNTEKATLDQGIQRLNTQTNWHFVMFASVPCPIVFSRSNSQAGSTAGNIENFLHVSPTGTLTTLSSPGGVAHVEGTWRSFTSVSAIIDVDKLAIVASPFVQTSILQQMAMHTGALFMGLGVQQESGSPGIVSPTRRLLNFGSNGIPTDLTPGEKCRANNESQGTANQISALFGCGD
jgi:hypothetical protein